MVLSELYFIACFRRGKWSWPSPVAMTALEKFFTLEEMEMKIYSILLDSSNFLNHRLTLSTNWNHRSQGGSWVTALLISAQTVSEGTAPSLFPGLRRKWCQKHCPIYGERMGSSHLLLYPIPTRPGRSRGENTWQPVPSVSLDVSPKSGKTEPRLSQQRCFECWQLCSQHDWYSDHKLHFLTKRDYKQKIWPNCLLFWFHWLFLKENSIWKLKIKTAAFCIAIDNRCAASNSNFPSVYTNVSPLGLLKNLAPAFTDFVCFTWAAVALQSQCRDYNRYDSHRDAGKSLKVFPGCRWVPCTSWWLLLRKRRLLLGLSCPGSQQLGAQSSIFSTKWVVGSVSSLISLLSWNNYDWLSYRGKQMCAGSTLRLLVALWERKNMLWLGDWTAVRSHYDNEDRALQSWSSWNQNLGRVKVHHTSSVHKAASSAHCSTWGAVVEHCKELRELSGICLGSSWGCPCSHPATVHYGPCSEVV